MEEKIVQEGVILPGNVLKVDGFLNHQVDIELMRFITQELQRRFEGVKVTKILTIEASGIAIAIIKEMDIKTQTFKFIRHHINGSIL